MDVIVAWDQVANTCCPRDSVVCEGAVQCFKLEEGVGLEFGSPSYVEEEECLFA